MNKVLKATFAALFLLIPVFVFMPKASAASPPVVCIDTPSQGQSFSTGSSIFNISGWVIAPAGVSTVSVRMDNSNSPYLNATIPASAMSYRGDVASVMSSYPGASGNKAFSVDFDTISLGAGSHAVNVTVTDVNGQSITNSKIINVVAPPAPIVCIETPSPEQSFSTGKGLFMISGWTIAAAGVSSVSIKMDNSNSPYLNATIPASAMNYRDDVARAMIGTPGASGNKYFHINFDTISLGAGRHAVNVTTTDLNGNSTTSTQYINVVAPPPPVVYIDWPAVNQNYNNGSILQASGWVIAPAGVKFVSVSVDGSSNPNLSYTLPASGLSTREDIASRMATYPGASANKAYSVGFNTQYIYAGVHTLYVTVTDSNGGSVTSAKAFTVTKPPARLYFYNIQSTINGALVPTNSMTSSFTVSGWALNPSNVAGIAIYLDNQYQGQAALTGSRSDVVNAYPGYAASNNTGFTFTLTPDLSKYSPGNHVITIISYGVDGTYTAVTENIQKLSPVLYVLPASTMPYTNYDGNSDIPVYGFALDDSIVNNVRVSLDGVNVGGVSTSIPSLDVQGAYSQYPGSSNAKFSATIPKSMLSNGIHIISVTSTGTDGVTQTKQIAITVGGSTYNTSYPITLTNLLTKEQSIAAGYGFTVGASDIDPTVVQGKYNGYEFLSLKYGLGGTGSTLTAAQLETMIPAMALDSQNNYQNSVSDILSTHAQAFIDAANTYGINPVYLVAHALLESGYGTSKLATGKDKYGNFIGYYNMYGICAYDSNPIDGGNEMASRSGWDSVDKAITGGAQWIATHYINSVSIHAGDGQQHYDQDTLYEMKWDPYALSTNQSACEYATEPDWAYNIARIMQSKNLLTGTNMTLVYDIPKYN